MDSSRQAARRADAGGSASSQQQPTDKVCTFFKRSGPSGCLWGSMCREQHAGYNGSFLKIRKPCAGGSVPGRIPFCTDPTCMYDHMAPGSVPQKFDDPSIQIVSIGDTGVREVEKALHKELVTCKEAGGSYPIRYLDAFCNLVHSYDSSDTDASLPAHAQLPRRSRLSHKVFTLDDNKTFAHDDALSCYDVPDGRFRHGVRVLKYFVVSAAPWIWKRDALWKWAMKVGENMFTMPSGDKTDYEFRSVFPKALKEKIRIKRQEDGAGQHHQVTRSAASSMLGVFDRNAATTTPEPTTALGTPCVVWTAEFSLSENGDVDELLSNSFEEECVVCDFHVTYGDADVVLRTGQRPASVPTEIYESLLRLLPVAKWLKQAGNKTSDSKAEQVFDPLRWPNVAVSQASLATTMCITLTTNFPCRPSLAVTKVLKRAFDRYAHDFIVEPSLRDQIIVNVVSVPPSKFVRARSMLDAVRARKGFAKLRDEECDSYDKLESAWRNVTDGCVSLMDIIGAVHGHVEDVFDFKSDLDAKSDLANNPQARPFTKVFARFTKVFSSSAQLFNQAVLLTAIRQRGGKSTISNFMRELRPDTNRLCLASKVSFRMRAVSLRAVVAYGEPARPSWVRSGPANVEIAVPVLVLDGRRGLPLHLACSLGGSTVPLPPGSAEQDIVTIRFALSTLTSCIYAHDRCIDDVLIEWNDATTTQKAHVAQPTVVRSGKDAPSSEAAQWERTVDQLVDDY